MTLKQLLYLREVARQTLNMSKAAAALYTSQPGISRQIQLLEQELGVQLLRRRKNRTLGFTEIGQSVLEASGRLLNEADTIKLMAAEARREGGRLAIVTTHLHARYTLLEPVSSFIGRHPDIQLQLMAAGPDEIARMLEASEADIGVSTEVQWSHPTLTRLSGDVIKRTLIMPKGHPLSRKKHISLADICNYPLLGFSPRSRWGQMIDDTFNAQGIQPRYRISVADSDVIKAYVAKGVGIAVLPAIALDRQTDRAFEPRDVTGLFPRSTITLSLRRNAYLRKHVIEFIRMLPGLSRRDIAALRQS